MTTGTELMDEGQFRALLVGSPKSGKTGSIAALANAGFRVLVFGFDKSANVRTLVQYTRPELRQNIYVKFFQDKLRLDNRGRTVPDGKPTAIDDAVKVLTKGWREYDKEGNVVEDLGKQDEWGLDTIVVLDSITALGTCAYWKAMDVGNRTPADFRIQDWGNAMNEQDKLVDRLTSSTTSHHTIITAHTRMISPPEIDEGKDDANKELKQQQQQLIPTKLYPSALGQQLPTQIARHTPTLLYYVQETDKQGKVARRRIHTNPRADIDVGVPAPDLPDVLTVEDGGLKNVFDAVCPGAEQFLTTTKE